MAFSICCYVVVWVHYTLITSSPLYELQTLIFVALYKSCADIQQVGNDFIGTLEAMVVYAGCSVHHTQTHDEQCYNWFMLVFIPICALWLIHVGIYSYLCVMIDLCWYFFLLVCYDWFMLVFILFCACKFLLCQVFLEGFHVPCPFLWCSWSTSICWICLFPLSWGRSQIVDLWQHLNCLTLT